MDEFMHTRIGQTYLNRTMPSIARSLATIAEKMDEPKKMDKKYLQAIDRVYTLAQGHVRELMEEDTEDADFLGACHVDLELVGQFLDSRR
jgi:hypothetical protein